MNKDEADALAQFVEERKAQGALLYVYKNIRGEAVPPGRIVRTLERIDKTELECKNFFGEQLWTAPGFAYAWLEMTAAQKAWCLERLP